MSSPIWGSWPDIYYCLTVTVLFLWGAFSDVRTCLSFVYAAGLASAVILGSESLGTRDHILLSDLRLAVSSPPTTRRVTVEVFDPASTRGFLSLSLSRLLSLVASGLVLYSRGNDKAENTVLLLRSSDHTKNKSCDSYLASLLARWLLPSNIHSIVACGYRGVFIEPLPSNAYSSFVHDEKRGM
jgi:hypothetical protein